MSMPAITMRALLIEDELHCRERLSELLGAHPEVMMVGSAAAFTRARERLRQPDYNLVFLDVHLLGGGGFDLVPELAPGARIIFTTADDQFAIRAFEINALDYLLKPITPGRLAASLQRAREALALATQPPAESAEPASEGAPLRMSDTLYLDSGLRARFAPVAEISLIVAQDNYSEVHLADGTKLFIRKNLKTWEASLPAENFMRVHRTQIVNLARVVRYERDRDEHTTLYLAGVAGPVSASRHRWSDLRGRLSHLHTSL